MAKLFFFAAILIFIGEFASWLWGPLGFSDRWLPALINIAFLVLMGIYSAYFRRKKRAIYAAFMGLMPLATGLTIGFFSVLVVYVDLSLPKPKSDDLYNACHKVWAARGLVEGTHEISHHGEQNSITSISRAFDAGALGTEVDVHFDVEKRAFIVSHDYPYNLKNGSILTLEELLRATGKHYYWLDFKKLRHLDEVNLKASVMELERLSALFDLKNHFYVEGEAPFSLAAYRDAGFKTIFDGHPVYDDHPLATTVINLYKVVYFFGGYDVMAMNYYFGHGVQPVYGERTKRLLSGIPLFIYHVPDDPQVLNSLVHNPDVRVILVVHHNLNRYDLNACTA